MDTCHNDICPIINNLLFVCFNVSSFRPVVHFLQEDFDIEAGLMARFVKVYRPHNLCRNVCSHNSCGNARVLEVSVLPKKVVGMLYVIFSITRMLNLWTVPLNHTAGLPFNGTKFF